MSSKNRDGKPTQEQIKKIRSLGGKVTKGIKTYRDAENYIKRLLRARSRQTVAEKTKTVKKPSSRPDGGYSCKLREKKHAADRHDRLPLIKDGVDCQRVRLPRVPRQEECKMTTVVARDVEDKVFNKLVITIDALVDLMNAISLAK